MPRAPKFTEASLKAAIEANLKDAEAKGKKLKRIIFVRDCANLYLRTSAKKKKQRWIFRFSRPDKSGVTERSLGRYPEVTLEMARNRANHMREILARDKIDPWEMGEDEGATLKFREVARRWVDSRDWANREKQRHDTEYFLFTCAKELLDKPLLKIKAKDICEALRPLWDRKPKQAKRAFTRIAAVFDFAKANHWYFAENPSSWSEKLKYLLPQFSNDRVNF